MTCWGQTIVGAWPVLRLAETQVCFIGLPLWFRASVIAVLACGSLGVARRGSSCPDCHSSHLHRWVEARALV